MTGYVELPGTDGNKLHPARGASRLIVSEIAVHQPRRARKKTPAARKETRDRCRTFARKTQTYHYLLEADSEE